jgi:hypothetical protein
MKVKELYLAWQDPIDRWWIPVGRLSFDSEKCIFRFVYTKGAEISPNFQAFGPMKDLHVAYESKELFPLFKNRLLEKSRPEYKRHLEWLNMPVDEIEPFMMLATTGGIRETDTLEVFACPERNGNGKYETHFLSHGLRHLDKHSIKRVDGLCIGERLFVMPDPQNPYDPSALALRTTDPMVLVGYCPRYLTHDFGEVLEKCGPDALHVTVERVNDDAPLHLRLLCKLVSPWPEGFEPCSDETYQPLA